MPDHIAATKKVQPAPTSLSGFASFVTLADKAADNAFEVIAKLRAHITDLTRRLAEAEAENGRFAGMLEASVSGWRKLYTEERAERVRIEGVLLNDVQAERQESDEHINGLNVVIKTQDKTIRDLKSRVVELAADWQVQFAKAEAAEARVRELEAFRARVMELAKGRCEFCKNHNPEHGACPENCYPGHITAWTMPRAWEDTK